MFPAKGEATGRVDWLWGAAAGVLRLVLFALAWLVANSVDTRLRAKVALVVVLLTVTAVTVTHIVLRVSASH